MTITIEVQMTIGMLCVQVLNESPNISIKEMITRVKSQFPESAFKGTHVGWYRNHFKYKTLSNRLNSMINDEKRATLFSGDARKKILDSIKKTDMKPVKTKVAKKRAKAVKKAS